MTGNIAKETRNKHKGLEITWLKKLATRMTGNIAK
jgi:hypothetical protein